jgi:hypothetical protein
MKMVTFFEGLGIKDEREQWITTDLSYRKRKEIAIMDIVVVQFWILGL